MSSSSRRRRHARSPAAGPLDDDDLLSEILLCLPPQPSSLPRASAVCKRWRRIVSDPAFFRRFRLRHRHRRNPPLLGFFDRYDGLSFLPTLESPNRIPSGRFSLQGGDNYDSSMSHGCRHGLYIIVLRKRLQVLVWDPVTGDQHRIALPPEVVTYAVRAMLNGAVLRAAEEAQHFQVVLAVADVDDKQHERALACVYSSKTGLWGNVISTPLPYQADESGYPVFDDSVLVGDSLYWLLTGDLVGILEFDLVKQSLAVIQVPVDMYGVGRCFKMMRAEGGGLGLLLVSESDNSAQLWKRKTDCDGVASWGLARTIELDRLLSLKPEEKGGLWMLGFAEENNVVFLCTMIGIFMIHLDSLKFKKLSETKILSHYHPFESVYTAGAYVDVGHDGAELLLNT